MRSELDKVYDELYSQFASSLQRDVLAVCFYILHRDFGYGEVRLNRFKTAIENEFEVMGQGVIGKEYNTSDILEMLKDLGVDLDSSNLS